MVASLPDQLDLNRLAVFLEVAQLGGFTAASRRLGIAKGRVSEQVAALERELGAALFTRTTRRVVLTEAGRALQQTATPLLRQLRQAVADLGDAQPRLQGVLKVTTTVDHAARFLAPALAIFSGLHSSLHVELRASDGVVDLVAENIDVAIRGGTLSDSSLRATRLGSFRSHLLASPEYLSLRGPPDRPENLASHSWIAMRQLRSPSTLTLVSAEGKTQQVQLKSRIKTDAVLPMRAFLRAGAGIGILDEFSAAEDLRDGSLVQVLPSWTLPIAAISAVYPNTPVVPHRTRAFIDFYSEYIGKCLRDPHRED